MTPQEETISILIVRHNYIRGASETILISPTGQSVWVDGAGCIYLTGTHKQVNVYGQKVRYMGFAHGSKIHKNC